MTEIPKAAIEAAADTIITAAAPFMQSVCHDIDPELRRAWFNEGVEAAKNAVKTVSTNTVGMAYVENIIDVIGALKTDKQ